jgi:hypothetical protein
MAENDTQVEEQDAPQAAPAPAERSTRRVKRKKTWQEKLDDGQPLTELEDVKSEADYSVRRHLREQKERQAFEARKNRSRKQAQLEGGE